jgi:outer membrane protein, heavy metal efflux system
MRRVNQAASKALFSLLIGLCCSVQGLAQETEKMAAGMSIEELTKWVLSNNTTYQASLKFVDQSKAATVSTGALPNPKLEWSQGQSSARMPGAFSGQIESWGISQFIENPNSRSARILAAQKAEKESVYQTVINRQELIAEVHIRSYEHFWRKETERLLKADYDLLKLVRDRSEIKVNSGEAARYELIKADAEVINAKQRYETASLQAEQVLLGLNRLAAGRLPANWRLEGNLGREFKLATLQEIQINAQKSNPEILALQAKVDRLESSLNATRSSRWPGLEFRFTQTKDPQLTQNVLGLQIPIPLWDQRAGPVAESAAELARARLSLDGKKAELEQQVLQAWKALDIARSRVDSLSKGSVREAESALRVAQAAYRFGERGILDVLDAQRVLQAVRTDLLEARYQLHVARIQLELLSGVHAESTS